MNDNGQDVFATPVSEETTINVHPVNLSLIGKNEKLATGNVTQLLVKLTRNIYLLVKLFPLTVGIKHFRSIKQIYYAVVPVVKLTQRNQSGF